MEERLLAVAKRFWPELETMSGPERRGSVRNVVGFLYSVPMALVGLVRLITITDLTLFRTEWPMLSLLFVLPFLFERLDFFFFVEVTPGSYSDWQASLGTVITWSAALIFGPSVLLYMALSRTLIRTYAVEYHTRPDYVLRVANRRILADTQAGLFVTVFYGVLDPTTGTLTYCNAGHNPPYLLSAQNGETVQALGRTGLPLYKTTMRKGVCITGT